MQDATASDLQREQDRVAALVDAAAPGESAPKEPWKGYPQLSPGPELTPAQLLKQVEALAQAVRAYGDSDPSKVEQVLGMALPADVEHERKGVAGRVGKGNYTWAVWKPYPERPGHIVELTLTPDACLAYEAMKAPLVADGFRVFVPTFGDDKRITFDKAVEASLGLHIAATPDSKDAPTCVTVVSFELDRRDA